jgi:ABC-2 type transport system permease protein
VTAAAPASPAATSFVVESLVFAGRQLTRWRRHPVVPIQGILFPTFLLITYHLLVSQSMMKLTGANSLYGLVPVCAVAGGMFGALGAALTIPQERDSGLLARFWTLPVHRASALAGRLIAEAARTFLGSVLITLVGVAFGLRFQSWTMIGPFLLVPVLIVVVFATIVISVALHSGGATMFTWLGMGSVALVFGNAGVAPLELFPGWLRTLVHYQPMSPTIDVMKQLSQGGPYFGSLMTMVAWAVAVAMVFGPLAVHRYRGVTGA